MEGKIHASAPRKTLEPTTVYPASNGKPNQSHTISHRPHFSAMCRVVEGSHDKGSPFLVAEKAPDRSRAVAAGSHALRVAKIDAKVPTPIAGGYEITKSRRDGGARWCEKHNTAIR